MRTLNQSIPVGSEEYVMLKRACTNKNLLCAMALLYFGGFRVNEVLQFNKGHIETILKKGEIDAYISKQNTKRIVLFSEKAKLELSTLLHFAKGKYFVRYSGDSLRVTLNRFVKKVLGDGFTSHGFRRGYITRIIDVTSNPKIAQTLIGHKDIKTTLRYYAPSKSDLRSAIEAL